MSPVHSAKSAMARAIWSCAAGRRLLLLGNVGRAARHADPLRAIQSEIRLHAEGGAEERGIRRRLRCRQEPLATSRCSSTTRPAISVSQLRTRARRLKRQTGPVSLIVVDYLQLMSADRGTAGRTEGRVQESLRHHPRPESHRQGTERAGNRVVAALPRRSSNATTSGRSWRTFGNPARSSRTPTWSCSCSGSNTTWSAAEPGQQAR